MKSDCSNSWIKIVGEIEAQYLCLEYSKKIMKEIICLIWKLFF